MAKPALWDSLGAAAYRELARTGLKMASFIGLYSFFEPAQNLRSASKAISKFPH